MASTSTSSLHLPVWMVLWLVISSIIVLADAGFLLARPHSMPGGKWDWFPMWTMYPLYYSIDKLYGDMDNAFVQAQAYLNLFEVLFNIIGLFVFKCGRRSSGVLLLFFAVALTLGKTMLYFVHEQVSPAHNHPTHHNFPDNLRNYLLLYVLPNSIWLIVPTIVLRNLFGQITNAMDGASSATKSKKN